MRSYYLFASSILGTILQISERKAFWVHTKCCRLNSNLVCVSLIQCTWRIKLICFSFLTNVSCSEQWSLLSRTSKTSQSTTEIKMSVARGLSIVTIIYLFTDYFMTLSMSHAILRRMVGWLMNDKLKRIWKEAIVSQQRYWGEPWNIYIRISNVLAKARIQHSPRTSHERYCSVSCSVTLPLF